MQIRQLQVANDQIEDRLILRVATAADEEFRVWVTRRLLHNVWPHLAGLLRFDLPHAAGEAPSFDKPFRDDKATYPLGAKPLLASELSFDPLPDDMLRLTFREGRERSFQLNLTPDMLQALCSMLRACSEKAHWGLALDYTSAPSSPQSPPTAPPSRLH